MSPRLWNAKPPSRVAAARALSSRCAMTTRVSSPPAGRCLPFDLDRVGAALRVPARAADDRERRRRAAVGAEANDALDAGERERRRDVDRARAAAEHRAVTDRREQQAGRSHVDAEAGAAVALGDGIDARRGGADQAPVLAPLQAHLAGRRRRRHARELAVVRRVARAVADDAVADDELARRLLPGDRRRAEQARARRRRGEAQHVPAVDDARRAAGDVDAELARDLGDDPLPGLRRRRLAARLGLARMEVRQAGDHRRDVAVEPVGARRTRRTRASGTSSSSATSMASAVCVPWPISLRFIASITVPSAPILIQPFRLTSPASTGNASTAPRRSRGGSTPQPTTSAPAAPRPLTSRARRFMPARPRRF
jgi:hypothetical protein